MKLNVMIEERLCRTVTIEVPNGSTFSSPEVLKAIDDVYDSYRQGDITLSSDDYCGEPQYQEELEDGAGKIIESSGWHS